MSDKSPNHSPNSADTRLSRFLGSGRITGKPDVTACCSDRSRLAAARLRFGQDDVWFEFRGVRCGLPTTRELSICLNKQGLLTVLEPLVCAAARKAGSGAGEDMAFARANVRRRTLLDEDPCSNPSTKVYRQTRRRTAHSPVNAPVPRRKMLPGSGTCVVVSSARNQLSEKSSSNTISP
jgi:hypothetical protein